MTKHFSSAVTLTPNNNSLAPDTDTGMSFLASDLRYIADQALKEAHALSQYGEFDSLMEIALDFKQMSGGQVPATWANVSRWLAEYKGADMDVLDDILDLLIEMEESV
jgi:hypothetical protein